MDDHTQCDIRPMHASDLDRVLAWRNHVDIRRHMLTQHLITTEEHHRWFERASDDPQRHIMLVQDQGVPFGLVHFSGVRPNASAEWGFYLAPDAPQGSGRRLGECAVNFAFATLHVHKLCGQVLAGNAASIRFHERLGFVMEGRLREQVFLQSRHCDLLCFGLLHSEWLHTPPQQG